MPLLRIAT